VSSAEAQSHGHFGILPIGLQWAVLLTLSVALVWFLSTIKLPAALFLGPMVAAVVLATGEATVRVPNWLFLIAQGVIGCMIARTFNPTIVQTMVSDWPLFIAVIAAVIALSSTLGWLLAHWQVLPGTTAIWGTSPGAATVMILMSEVFGGDVRLVAFMQYLRVVLVAMVASVVARLWVGPAAGHVAAVAWFPPIMPIPFTLTLALAGFGAAAGRMLRVPAGAFLVPLIVGAVLHATGTMEIVLPPWLLASSYAVVGWSVGLRFTRPILMHAIRLLPRILASTFALIALCGGLGVILSRATGIDPLTAYLATSPGGADSVAIIGASSHVDLPFVMALQTARFLAVLVIGPWIAKFVVRRTRKAG
jgi:membrane AbrB-like protein